MARGHGVHGGCLHDVRRGISWHLGLLAAFRVLLGVLSLIAVGQRIEVGVLHIGKVRAARGIRIHLRRPIS